MDKLLAALIHPQPPLLSMALPGGPPLWMPGTLGRGGAAISLPTVWWPARETQTHLPCFAFGRSHCSRSRSVHRRRCTNTAFALGYCHHADETPDFRFPQGLTSSKGSAPGQQPLHECRNAALGSPTLPDIFYRYTFMWQAVLTQWKSNIHTFARGHPSSSWVGSFYLTPETLEKQLSEQLLFGKLRQSCHLSPILQVPQCCIFSRQLHIYVVSKNIIAMQNSAVIENAFINSILDFFCLFFKIKCSL